MIEKIRERLFGSTVDEVMKALDMPEPAKVPDQISDVLCTRDSYFHSCWLRMKLLKPELIKEMGDIELFIAGYDTSKDETETEDAEEEHGQVI